MSPKIIQYYSIVVNIVLNFKRFSFIAITIQHMYFLFSWILFPTF